MIFILVLVPCEGQWTELFLLLLLLTHNILWYVEIVSKLFLPLSQIHEVVNLYDFVDYDPLTNKESCDIVETDRFRFLTRSLN